jgi:hypothetical protein
MSSFDDLDNQLFDLVSKKKTTVKKQVKERKKPKNSKRGEEELPEQIANLDPEQQQK